MAVQVSELKEMTVGHRVAEMTEQTQAWGLATADQGLCVLPPVHTGGHTPRPAATVARWRLE